MVKNGNSPPKTDECLLVLVKLFLSCLDHISCLYGKTKKHGVELMRQDADEKRLVGLVSVG